MSPGEVRSPDWNGTSVYPAGVDSWVYLSSPSQHFAMLTFLALDIKRVLLERFTCSGDRVVIQVMGSSRGHWEQAICGHTPPRQKIYHATSISVGFITDWNQYRRTGFRLLYSFHSRGQTLQQLVNGTWNCSVAFWTSVRDHFPCNLVGECAGLEDELDCPYSSPLCHPGEFSLGHSCYLYFGKGQEITWNNASAQCQMRNSHLVSLNDADEWKRITELLQHSGVKRVYTGLRSAVAALPHR